MIIACPDCMSGYEVASGEFPAGGGDVKCHKCGHVWFAAADSTGARAKSGGSRGRAAGKVAIFIAALALVAAGALYARTGIVRLLPGTGTLYAALGMPVNLRGLDFQNITVETDIEDGRTVLSVRGEIVNLTGKQMIVPAIRYSLRDAAGLEIYHWIGVAAAPKVSPAGSVTFLTRLASPPTAGEDVTIRFVGGAEAAAKGGS